MSFKWWHTCNSGGFSQRKDHKFETSLGQSKALSQNYWCLLGDSGLQLVIFPPLSPECWAHRPDRLCPVYNVAGD